MRSKWLCLLAVCAFACPVAAQNQPTLLVTQTVDATSVVALHGTVHPLVRFGLDRGPVNESTPAERLLLVLNRPPEREAAFQQLLKDLHTLGSPSYHQWLTPDEIGNRFGPAASDLDAVTGWLRASGFSVNRVSRAGRFIEFSGNVGQVNAAFHTEIHEYVVNGAVHHANATEVRIPQALAGIVKGVSPLSDFRPQPQLHPGGKGRYDAAARQFVPEFTLPSSWSPLLYGVAPADFATEYDLAPLYSASVTGAGKTIGIIDESNIDVSLDNDYRSVFGLTANPVQVVLDGGDPGMNSSDVESYLDVEVAGAVAPGATVNLYISAGSPYQDPLALAALRAVEDNQADVLSISWGAGEQELESSGNQFWNALWEQAAAQGQTVLVSAGDMGQIPDESYLYTQYLAPAVNGLASTPWNVAVGGTDFYYSDYASGAPSASTFWNATNDPTTKGSLKARLPEQVWNDPFGLDAISNGLQRNEIYAGGGGASNCSTENPTTYACISGYVKPAWQTGPGVPADGARDIPDVSLFASNGANFSGYVTCDYEGACTPDASGNFGVDVVGGTSASAPAMASIMALVDQKYGRQGQADAVLYPLAQQKPSSFHDITLGGNWAICLVGDQDCTLGLPGWGTSFGESTVYSATPGFDLASGWGSIDAANLVNNWGAISFRSTTTSLQVFPAEVTHGSNVTLTTSVTPASGSGTPTGAVAILSNSTLPSNAGQTAITLTGGSGSTTVNYLPGGTYHLTAQYGGDGTFSASSSSPQTLTVSPEKSTLQFTAEGQYGSSLTYGVPVYLSAEPVGVNAPLNSTDGAATGSVAFTVDGATTSIPLNVGGIASWTTPALPVGSHTASASYSGDASFQSSSAAAINFSVTKGYPSVNLNVLSPASPSGPYWVVNSGGSISLAAEVGPNVGILSGGVAPPGVAGPTGTVTICLNTSANVATQACTLGAGSYSQTVPLASPSGMYGLYSEATATFSNLAAGGYMPQFVYNGDSNWQVYGLDYLATVMVQAPTPQTASNTTLSVSPSSISGTQGATLTTTVTGANGVAPTGYVYYFNNGNSLTYDFLIPSATGATSSDVFSVSPAWFWNSGSNQVVAIYNGDNNYAGSTSNTVNLSVTQTVGDFMIAPAAPQITVAGGSSGSVTLNLTSVNSFNGALSLTCTPSSSEFSCSVSPSSASLSTTASAMLTINATVPGATGMLAPGPQHGGLFGVQFGAGTVLAFGIVLALPMRKRRWPGNACLVALLSVFLMASCGGGSGSSTSPTNPITPVNATPSGTYTVLVTGTANGIVHNAKVTVVVP